MRSKFGSLRDWFPVHGEGSFAIDDHGPRRLAVEFVTQGASVLIEEEGRIPVLIFSGIGHVGLDIGLPGAAILHVEPFKPSLKSALRMDGVQPREVGWTDGSSITDFNPPSLSGVSPQIQSMFDTMQRNMLRMRAELEHSRR